MINLNSKYKTLTDYLKSEAPFEPELSIILGSGLGDFAEQLQIHKSISTSDIPGYPESTVVGHKGKIHFAEYENKKLILFQGRVHFYEGYDINECVIPVFISHKLGADKLLLTNAAGGINKNFSPGDLMLITSFNGILIKKELTDLIGLTNPTVKNNFLDLPCSEMNKVIKESAKAEGINLKEGVYFFTKGPSYETPAEINFIEQFGSDAVGMSTVHEAVYASYLEMKVSAISCITNFAAGISDQKLSHSEVTETADRVKDTFARLVKAVVKSV
ncbi:MAG: purine-nucleoside phosphorylase [Ignavibacteriaceae bacterium]|jgi:purine-nucleoside phosphorylase|nr:purine-nucleoside phosphorylase [Ignavibacteriaceae bacterium]